jgi:tripartite-type tricarboxylate transporter receptor subunit TctC
MRVVFRTVLSFLLVGSGWAADVHRQGVRPDEQYPARPVRIILGNAAGGTVDTIARTLAEDMTQQMKQHVLIENRPGAGGSIASEYAAKATPDGYTLYLGGLDSIVYSFRATGRNPLDPVKDFTPIAEVARNEFLLVVHSDLPVASVTDLVKLARARPQSILFASNGSGTTLHILAERFAVSAEIELVHVPYKQGLIGDLLGGRVHLVFAPMPAIRDLIATGKLKVLATLAPQRSANAPDRPTLVESGFPGFWHIGLLHLYAPAATPHSIVLRLNRETRKALEAPGFQTRLAGLGDAPGTPMSVDEAAVVLRERRAWMDKAFDVAMSPRPALRVK